MGTTDGEKAAKLLSIDKNNIKNKIKRQEIFQKQKQTKKAIKDKAKKKRKKEAEKLGDAAPPKKAAKTLDNTREVEETIVDADDEEVINDEQIDEFSQYFEEGKTPKILITTNTKPTKRMYDFLRDILRVFPNSFYYARKKYELKKICKYASERDFTDVIVLNEDRKEINALTIIHLDKGPTAHFKLTRMLLNSEIKGHGSMTDHQPELILKNFDTRLGHRIGRMLGALFHQEPNFKGRRVVTFQNQRDFIFFRQHRYIFDSVDKVRLQELGPRFTLKLQWLQHGTFDTKYGEMEWMRKNDMGTSRRRFML